MKGKDNYETRFHEYLRDNLHPETAANLKEMVFHSPLGSAEFTMGVILQMQLDHVRKDQDMQIEGQGQLEYGLADREGEALPPQIERTEVVQVDFNNRTRQ